MILKYIIYVRDQVSYRKSYSASLSSLAKSYTLRRQFIDPDNSLGLMVWLYLQCTDASTVQPTIQCTDGSLEQPSRRVIEVRKIVSVLMILCILTRMVIDCSERPG